MTNESAVNDLKLALLFGDVPPSHFSILPLLKDQSVTGFFIHKADGVYEMKFTTPEARQNFLVKGSLTVGNRSLPIKTWPFIATERYLVLDVGLDVAEEDVQKAFEKGMYPWNVTKNSLVAEMAMPQSKSPRKWWTRYHPRSQ